MGSHGGTEARRYVEGVRRGGKETGQRYQLGLPLGSLDLCHLFFARRNSGYWMHPEIPSACWKPTGNAFEIQPTIASTGGRRRAAQD